VALAEVYFFDLDRTLVKVNITSKFLVRYFRNSPLSFIEKLIKHFSLFLKHQLNPGDLRIAHELISKMIGDDYTRVLAFSSNFWTQIVNKEIFLPVYEELKFAQHRGKKIVILSAAPNFIVDPIAKKLGDVEAYSTTYTFDPINGIEVKNILYGIEKAKIVNTFRERLQIEKNDLTAYSDSIQDIEFLCSVGCPVIVNADKKLREIARRENWRVIS
jgi:HAD superfamily hydrolase (TIGR01490 family)